MLPSVQMYRCECIHVSYSGSFDCFMITTAKTRWWWQVWCAETCCRIDNEWRIFL